MVQNLLGSYSNFTCSHTVTEVPQSKNFDRHCHQNYELLYVVRGEGRYQVEGVEYPVQSNTLILIRPFEFHFLLPNEKVPYERYVINFESDAPIGSAAMLPFLQSDKQHRHGVLFSADCISERVRDAFAEIDFAMTHFSSQQKSVSREEALIRLNLSRILLLLSMERPIESAVPEKNVITQVMEYLNLHLRGNISLDRIAQRFFISKYYLCHAFRAHTGVSILTYINKKRIAMAQHLLEAGEPAASVADQAGFKSYTSFYRTYCKLMGHAPSRCRQERLFHGEESGMFIRKAVAEDLPCLMQIYEDARAFMRENGNPNQWGDYYPSQSLIESDINSGNCHVCMSGDEIVGVFYYKEGIDPTYVNIYDGEWLNDKPYGVIHRIAVKKHSRGVASCCFDYCFSLCQNIKIDTHRDNLPMQRSLAKNGFVRCGIIYLDSKDERIAYQKA